MGGGDDPASGDVIVDQASLRVGTMDGLQGGNGLPFATASDTPETFEGTPVSVTMVRFHRDRDTRQVTMIVSDETVTLTDLCYDGFYRDATFTMGGVGHDLSETRDHPDGGGLSFTDIEYGLGRSTANRHEVWIAEGDGIDTFWD